MKTQDSLKPVGTWEVRHRIKIPALVHAADAMVVERAVSALPGVCKVAADVEKHQVIVRYDRCQPWRAKRRLVVPGSREAALLTRRALRQRGSKVGIRARRPV
ncbi:MAG: cation transporter, partial [gamma proteobacterium endosymbiont of Lamellibrachia anaximandri]|nr:cation transporter [gamma proteobacterium endosymbiont of Lamellibrachia anaximandri]